MEGVRHSIFWGAVGGLIGCVIFSVLCLIINEPKCSYCRDEIKPYTEIVYMPDGRKMHGECYLQYIKEDEHATE